MRRYGFLILLMPLLISAVAYAGNNVEIHFNYPDDSIYVGITNTLEIWIENDDTIKAMSLGLEFSGYSGIVTWDAGYGSNPPMNMEGDAVDVFTNGVMAVSYTHLTLPTN